MPLGAVLAGSPDLGSPEHVTRAADRVETAEREPRLRFLVRDHFDLVWRLLRRLGVPATLVEDAAQEVFLVAARRVDAIALGSERSYLFGTALRVARAVRRKQTRDSARLEPLADDAPSEQRSPEELIDQRRDLELLDQVLTRLEESERTVFVLFELEGLTLGEIAGLTGARRGTVASRLRRARARFARALRARTGRDLPMRGRDE